MEVSSRSQIYQIALMIVKYGTSLSGALFLNFRAHEVYPVNVPAGDKCSYPTNH